MAIPIQIKTHYLGHDQFYYELLGTFQIKRVLISVI